MRVFCVTIYGAQGQRFVVEYVHAGFISPHNAPAVYVIVVSPVPAVFVSIPVAVGTEAQADCTACNVVSPVVSLITVNVCPLFVYVAPLEAEAVFGTVKLYVATHDVKFVCSIQASGLLVHSQRYNPPRASIKNPYLIHGDHPVP